MQTFLPYADFGRSMQVLDQARLGKQRVETLQVLRSLLLPSYGWQNHPVSRMWRGYVPGLTAYGLANVAEWTSRGHADSTRPLIAEFAPDVEHLTQSDLAERGLLPRWVGDDDLHRSHRSNLIRKDAEFYSPLFPGDPADLEYKWPGVGIGITDPTLTGHPVSVVRVQTAAELDRWRQEGIVAIAEVSPRGRDTPAWRAQVATFVNELHPSDEVGVLIGNDQVLHRARVIGDATSMVADDGAYFAREAEFVGTWRRTDFAVPATLQDPRSIFTAHLAV